MMEKRFGLAREAARELVSMWEGVALRSPSHAVLEWFHAARQSVALTLFQYA